MHDFLKLVRVVVATLILAVAYTSSPVAAEDSQGQTVTDQSPTGELTFWNGIKDSNDVANFKTYLKNFPNGMFYDVALAKYQALGGNISDVKPAINSNVNPKASVKTISPGTSSPSKVKEIFAKKQTAQKKVVRYKAQKRAQVHIVKRTSRKHVAIKSKYIVKRKSSAPTREGGGGGGGGGGSGGGGNWG